MANLKKEEWDESYNRQENFIFSPKEEVVKFLNRFVRKKMGINSFRDQLKLSENAKALDLGCGIGRQTILLKEFGFDAYGVDISEVAIEQAKALSKTFGYNLDANFVRVEKIALPFEDNFFDIAICDSVLDSMEFSFAKNYLNELNRTVKNLLYLNLIASDSSDSSGAEDLLVESQHEQGTIQSFYDENRIRTLINETNFEIIQLNKNSVENLLNNSYSVRFNVVLQKKSINNQ
jgi:ubiquinone/menaquinone biosynthesis C-methylase UbiE